MLIEFHRNMLADSVRNEAFYRALEKVIVPGKTIVADLGSGTGLLSFMASKLGAKSVYAYEYSEALKLSQKLARENGIRNVHFIHNHSTKVAKPTMVDVIVSETLGNYAYEENILESVEDAKRFLKPNGIVIPHRIEQFVAPVVSSRFFDELCVWDRVGYGLDFSIAKEMSSNNLYVRTFAAQDLLEQARSAVRWDAADLNKTNKSVRVGKASWILREPITIYGFAVWWDCELVPGISLGTSPLSPRTHWEQLYFPLRKPMLAQTGDQLNATIKSDSRFEVGVNVTWEGVLRRKDKIVAQDEMDMRQGDAG